MKRISILAVLISLVLLLTGCESTPNYATDINDAYTYNVEMQKKKELAEQAYKAEPWFSKERKQLKSEYEVICVEAKEAEKNYKQLQRSTYKDDSFWGKIQRFFADPLGSIGSIVTGIIAAIGGIIAAVLLKLFFTRLFAPAFKLKPSYATPKMRDVVQEQPKHKTLALEDKHGGYYDEDSAMEEIERYCRKHDLNVDNFISDCGSIDAAIVKIRGY